MKGIGTVLYICDANDNGDRLSNDNDHSNADGNDGHYNHNCRSNNKNTTVVMWL